MKRARSRTTAMRSKASFERHRVEFNRMKKQILQLALFFGSYKALADRLHISQCNLSQYVREEYRTVAIAAVQKLVGDLYAEIKRSEPRRLSEFEKQYSREKPKSGLGRIITFMRKAGIKPMDRRHSTKTPKMTKSKSKRPSSPSRNSTIKEGQKKVMSIAILPGLHKKLKRHTDKAGVSTSAYIGELVERAIKENVVIEEPAAQAELVAAVQRIRDYLSAKSIPKAFEDLLASFEDLDFLRLATSLYIACKIT